MSDEGIVDETDYCCEDWAGYGSASYGAAPACPNDGNAIAIRVSLEVLEELITALLTHERQHQDMRDRPYCTTRCKGRPSCRCILECFVVDRMAEERCR